MFYSLTHTKAKLLLLFFASQEHLISLYCKQQTELESCLDWSRKAFLTFLSENMTNTTCLGCYVGGGTQRSRPLFATLHSLTEHSNANLFLGTVHRILLQSIPSHFSHRCSIMGCTCYILVFKFYSTSCCISDKTISEQAFSICYLVHMVILALQVFSFF